MVDGFVDGVTDQECQRNLKLAKSNTRGETLAKPVKKTMSRGPIQVKQAVVDVEVVDWSGARFCRSFRA